MLPFARIGATTRVLQYMIPSMLNLSVIILTCNRRQKLLNCLEKLLSQLGDGDEIVLLDTGSTDGTVEYIKTCDHSKIRLIEWTTRDGSWAEMRNHGIRCSVNPVVAFLDDDCLPDDAWVNTGKEAISHAHAVGGIVSPWHVTEFPAWWHPAMGWMAGLCEPEHMSDRAGITTYPFTANLWVRRSVCIKQPFQELGGDLGGQESGKYLTGREDAQFWRRLRTGGYCTRFNKQLRVYHHFDAGLRMRFSYVNKRAQLDGLAWSAREGTQEDIQEIAYQCWHSVFFSLADAIRFRQSFLPRLSYGYLMWQRHAAALRGLISKFPSKAGRAGICLGVLSNLLFQGTRYLFHRSKDLIRTIIEPFNGQKSLKKFPAGIMAGASRPENCSSGCINKLLVVGFGYLGDLIILQSCVRGLQNSYPAIDIHILTPVYGRLVFGNLPGIHHIPVRPEDEMHGRTRRSVRWLSAQIDSINPDLIIAPYLHGDWGDTLACISRLPCPAITFDQDHELAHKRYLDRIEWKIRKDLRFHEVENILGMMAAAGLPAKALPPILRPKSKITNPFSCLPDSETSPLVMLNPDAGKPYKAWSEAGWTRLIEKITSQTKMRIVINNSHSAGAFKPECFSKPDRIHSLDGCTLDELCSWMSFCDVLVTVDAGPQHIAHALNIPSLTLFGPMDERRWSDYFNRPIHRTIRGCTPFLTTSEKSGLPINHEVLLIRTEDIFEALVRLTMDIQTAKSTRPACSGES